MPFDDGSERGEQMYLARVYRVGAENDDPGPVFTAYGGHGSV